MMFARAARIMGGCALALQLVGAAISLANPNPAPAVEPDGDRQSNLFEFIAGGAPVDPPSNFHLRIEPAPGDAAQKALIFGPRSDDRTYTVTVRPSLTSGMWQPLAVSAQTDHGLERTVTDLIAADPPR